MIGRRGELLKLSSKRTDLAAQTALPKPRRRYGRICTMIQRSLLALFERGRR
jgi:hypothetical protein